MIETRFAFFVTSLRQLGPILTNWDAKNAKKRKGRKGDFLCWSALVILFIACCVSRWPSGHLFVRGSIGQKLNRMRVRGLVLLAISADIYLDEAHSPLPVTYQQLPILRQQS